MDMYTDLKDIERSLIKTYRKSIWVPFIKALNEFKLIEDGDVIGICISGGKDSLLLAKLFQELKKHGKKNFELKFITMDPGFDEENRKSLESNCEYLNIPVIIKESNIFKVAEKIAGENPCYMCARMRRGFLYSFAKELGCNKIALGHHFDDVIETVVLNMFYSGNYKTMLPKLKSENFEGLQLIRPLYYVREKDVIRYTMFTKLPVMKCGCTVAAGKTSSKRAESKRLIAMLKEFVPDIDKSIMSSTFNVNVDSVIGYKLKEEKHSFLDEFEE